jgi:hypothetical protein
MSSHRCTDSVHFTRKAIMYLSTMDMLAVMLALVVSITFVITTAVANARLTASRDEWREAYYDKCAPLMFDGE